VSARRCEHCGAPLDGQRRDARHCSPQCRYAAWEARSRRSGGDAGPDPAQDVPTPSNAFGEATAGLPRPERLVRELGYDGADWTRCSEAFWQEMAAIQRRRPSGAEKRDNARAAQNGSGPELPR
jgi:hypothetical protein